eukprot:362959-Chlamydomonas_euryale.AAC.2
MVGERENACTFTPAGRRQCCGRVLRGAYTEFGGSCLVLSGRPQRERRLRRRTTPTSGATRQFLVRSLYSYDYLAARQESDRGGALDVAAGQALTPGLSPHFSDTQLAARELPYARASVAGGHTLPNNRSHSRTHPSKQDGAARQPNGMPAWTSERIVAHFAAGVADHGGQNGCSRKGCHRLRCHCIAQSACCATDISSTSRAALQVDRRPYRQVRVSAGGCVWLCVLHLISGIVALMYANDLVFNELLADPPDDLAVPLGMVDAVACYETMAECSVQITCLSRPLVSAGPRLETCMHVNARGRRPPALGHLRACMPQASGRPRPR